jgi:hypothetical protein
MRQEYVCICSILLMQEYVLYADGVARMNEYLFGSDEAGIYLSCVDDFPGINALF